jgi:hypothetical protein
MVPDEPPSGLITSGAVAAYAPLWGSMMIGSAFSCATGALMLRDRTLFASPVPEGVAGMDILKENRDYPVELIQCIRYNCESENAAVLLRKSGRW